MLLALLILIVYIVGPALILIWAFKRIRHGVKPSGMEIGVVVMALVLIGIFTYSYTWNVTDRDTEDALSIKAQMAERFDFPRERFGDGPALKVRARTREIEIRVYGVLDRDDQDRILAIARDLRKKVAAKPLVVQFYEEEKWEIHSDGTRFPRPDLEVPMRERRIE